MNFLLLFSLIISPQQFEEIKGSQEFTGQMIVRPIQNLEAQERAQEILSQFTLIEYVKETDEYVIGLPKTTNENVAHQALMETGVIEYAEPNWMLYPVNTVPNDPNFGSQWQHSKMRSTTAWDYGTGDGTFIACTVDTGVDLNHPDLQANLVPGYNSADRRTQNSGGSVGDINGHGTMTLGCVGAIGNNNRGVVGMAWDIKLMPVRCTNSSGGGAYLADLTDGARWASDNGARAVSVSYSGGNSNTVESTGSHLRGEGSLLSWSSGNSGNRVNGSDHASVIVVGASNQGDNRTSWSTYGSWVDVVAPGDGVRTTSDGGGTASVSGTSFSCPIVSGVLAMMMITSPNSTPAEIEQMLYDNCVDLSSNGEDIYTGHGRPDFADCMEAADAANGGGNGGYDSINFSVSDTTPNAGQGMTFSCSNAPANSPYYILWSTVDRSPFFTSYQGIVGSGTSTSAGNSSYYRVVPPQGAGRTVYLETQYRDASNGQIVDSNTVRLDIN
jgi:thermitase